MIIGSIVYRVANAQQLLVEIAGHQPGSANSEKVDGSGADDMLGRGLHQLLVEQTMGHVNGLNIAVAHVFGHGRNGSKILNIRKPDGWLVYGCCGFTGLVKNSLFQAFHSAVTHGLAEADPGALARAGHLSQSGQRIFEDVLFAFHKIVGSELLRFADFRIDAFRFQFNSGHGRFAFLRILE